MEPVGLTPKDFAENTLFWINQEFAIVKNGKVQRRGKVCSVICFLFDKMVAVKVNFSDEFNRSPSIKYGKISTRR